MIQAPKETHELTFRQCLEILARRRRIFAEAFALILAASAFYAFTTRPVYEGAALLEIEKPRENPAPNAEGPILGAIDDDYFETEYRLLKSDSLDQKVFDKLHLAAVADFAPPRGLTKLQDAVTIAPIPRTRLAYVRVRAHDPRMTASIANALAGAFVQEHIHNALFMSRDVLRALQGDPTDPGQRRLYESLPEVVDNRVVQSTKEAKIALEGQIADLEQRLAPRHPQLISAKARLAALNADLQREIDNIVASLKAQLSGQLLANNARIVDPAAVPAEPVKPRKPVVLFFGLIGGLAAGFLSIAIAEMLDQSVRTKYDLAAGMTAPFFGVIPYARRRRRAKVFEALLRHEATPVSEAFRNLRTMLDLAGGPQGASSLIVTGAMKDEGKSFVAANLAVAFAQAGENVFLIDGDLRRPSLHRAFSIDERRGVADVLTGTVPIERMADMVQATEIPRLWALTCGQVLFNPSELLNSPRLADIIAWAQRSFRRVIVDCPPLFPISDTLLWGRHLRSALFVTRFGRSRAPLVFSAREHLELAGIRTLGVVINAEDSGTADYEIGYYGQQYRTLLPALPSRS